MKRFSKLSLLLLLFGMFMPGIISAQKATWMWYPGDFEIWLGNEMQNRRTERGAFFPPFWKMDSHYVLIDFHKNFELAAPEEIEIAVEGRYNVKLDGKLVFGSPAKMTIPAGKHQLNIKVHNQANVPAVYIKGKTLVSDASWLCTYEDKEWIDESGKASDQSGTIFLNAATWNFDDAQTPPSKYQLARKAVSAKKAEKSGKSLVVDFGKETFGYVKLHGLKGKGTVNVYYGESREEAMATGTCETLDRKNIDSAQPATLTLDGSRAFRYVNVECDGSVQLDSVSMVYEYQPLTYKGSFRCNDNQINKIWDVAAYTMHLTTREFFIDGIKRDRWIWSGDAYQSYLMNYYLFFDEPTVTRTLWALRGKDPVTSHTNTIMDYTFYWFLGVYDYYQYTGDENFIRQAYPRMVSMMDYVLGRRNANGMLEGLAGDWQFIDWADKLSKKGEVSFEQLLFTRSLEAMSTCARIAKDAQGESKYGKLAADMKDKFFKTFWSEDKKAIIHNRVNGQLTDNVTRYSNMFAIFFNYFTEKQKQEVKQSVLLNDKIQKITTPYMRFYELESLCTIGEQAYVLKEMKDYWGGMLDLGATSFWEEYNPAKKGADHYAMYGRPFGKSLCHAWGASPIYLLGKYYLGVKPTSPAYQTYLIEPKLGGLQWMEGDVPTHSGKIHVYCNTKEIKVKSDTGTGTLRISSKSKPSCKGAQIVAKGNGIFEMTVEKDKEYLVKYQAK